MGLEMKRVGNLIDLTNLYQQLYTAFKNAQKHKSSKPSFIRFEKNLEENLKSLEKDIRNHTYKHGQYHTRTIYEPKERLIYIANVRDRVIHWLIYSAIKEVFDKTFIHNSYACRKGYGQHKASRVLAKYCHQYKYCLKFDIRKYFPTMNHDVIKKLFRKKIKDKTLIYLFDAVIDSLPEDKGLPIGNLTSQICGNIYRTPLDYFIKQDLKCKAYANYMDDGHIFGNDFHRLEEIAKQIDNFLQNNLHQSLSKCRILSCRQGLVACGYRIFPNYILLKKRNKLRIINRINGIMKKIKKCQYNDRMLGQVASALGQIKYCNSYTFSNKYSIEDLKTILLKLRDNEMTEDMKQLLKQATSVSDILSEEQLKTEKEKTVKIANIVSRPLLIKSIEEIESRFLDKNGNIKYFFRIDGFFLDTEAEFIIKESNASITSQIKALMKADKFPITLKFEPIGKEFKLEKID